MSFNGFDVLYISLNFLTERKAYVFQHFSFFPSGTVLLVVFIIAVFGSHDDSSCRSPGRFDRAGRGPHGDDVSGLLHTLSGNPSP